MRKRQQHSTSPADAKPELWRALSKGRPVAAIYARISPTPESEVGANYSIKSQLHEQAEHAKAQGWYTDSSLQFVDDNYSGGDLNRPALDRLRDLIASKSIDVALTFSTDRLARRAVHLMLIKEECDKHGVKLEFVRDRFESTPEGKLLMGIKAHVDEFEKEKFKERSARGRRQQAREGYWPSNYGVPFGYRRLGKKEKNRGTIEIVEEQAKIVRLIFHWYVIDGKTLYEVRALLNEGGHKSAEGGLWSRTTVWQTLRHVTYTGERQGPGGETLRCDPIISKELYLAAKARLAENLTKAGRPSTRFLLRRMLHCRICKKRCYGRSDGHYGNYYCGNIDHNTQKKRCAGLISQTRLERSVWNAIWRTITDPATLMPLIEAHFDSMENDDDRRDVLLKKIARLQAAEKRAEEILYNPTIQIKNAAAKLQEIQIELAQATAELRRTGQVQPMPKKAMISAFCREILANEPETFEEKRGTLERLGAKVYYADKQVEINLAIALGPAADGSGYCHSGVHGDDNKNRPIPLTIHAKVA